MNSSDYSMSSTNVKQDFFRIRLVPLILALATFVFLLAAFPFGGFRLVSNLLGESDEGTLYQRIQRKVLSHNPDGKKSVIVVGGSQILQGFPPQEDVVQAYRDLYGETIDFLDAGFSTQSIAETILILSEAKIDKNTLVFVHISPRRIKNTTPVSCAKTRMSYLLNRAYFDRLKQPFDYNCFRIMAEGQVSYLLDIAADVARRLYGTATGQPEMPPLKPLKRFRHEKYFLEDPIKYVRANVRELIKKTARKREARKKKSAIEGGKTKNSQDAEKSAEPDISFYYTALKQLVEIQGGKVFLLEMPWNENFRKNNPAFKADRHKDAPDVYQWLLDNVVNGKRFNLAALTDRYYEKVRALGLNFVSFRRPAFVGRDFYDSMHLTVLGRRKFLPLFFEFVHNEFDLRNSDTGK